MVCAGSQRFSDDSAHTSHGNPLGVLDDIFEWVSEKIWRESVPGESGGCWTIEHRMGTTVFFMQPLLESDM